MVKKTVTYEDFNGVERTEDLYFNLNELEVVKLASDLPDEITDTISGNATTAAEAEAIATKFVEKLGTNGIIEFIEKLLLKSYGVKSEDGRSFIKNEKLSKDFEYSGAFSAIVMDLMTDDKAASDFVNQIIPAKLAAKLAEAGGNKLTQFPNSNDN